jgi:hypothetical protein
MTTTTAALVLAWIAIVLLTLATAGLLRRVEQLSSRGAPAAEAGMGPAHGLQVPMARHLGDFAGGDSEVLLLFASPACATCQAAVDALVAAHPAGHRIGVVIRERDPGPLRVPDGWVRLTSAPGLFQLMRVPATPYLVRLSPDGTIVDAMMLVGDLDLAHRLTRQAPITNSA